MNYQQTLNQTISNSKEGIGLVFGGFDLMKALVIFIIILAIAYIIIKKRL